MTAIYLIVHDEFSKFLKGEETSRKDYDDWNEYVKEINYEVSFLTLRVFP